MESDNVSGKIVTGLGWIIGCPAGVGQLLVGVGTPPPTPFTLNMLKFGAEFQRDWFFSFVPRNEGLFHKENKSTEKIILPQNNIVHTMWVEIWLTWHAEKDRNLARWFGSDFHWVSWWPWESHSPSLSWSPHLRMEIYYDFCRIIIRNIWVNK